MAEFTYQILNSFIVDSFYKDRWDFIECESKEEKKLLLKEIRKYLKDNNLQDKVIIAVNGLVVGVRAKT